MDWFFWRIVTSDKIRVGLVEIETQWTIDDVLDAHLVLDALESAEAEAEAIARAKRANR